MWLMTTPEALIWIAQGHRRGRAAGLIVDDRRYIAGPLTLWNSLTPLKTRP
jgi:hypothetical protein